MRCWWQIFVLWVFWVLILWLVAPCLDLTPEPEPQEELMYLVTWHCSCPWFKFRKYGCSSGTLNCSSCHHTAGESNWFNACYKRTVEFLRGTKESMTPDAKLWWLGLNSESKLTKMWKKLLTVIPTPSGSHFDLYCRTCVVMGSSQILWGSGHSINQHTKVFRRNQAPVWDFEMNVGNRTTGRFNYPMNAGDQSARSWLVLLLLKLSDLAWTSDILNLRRFQFPSGVEDHKSKVTFFGFGSEKQGKRPHYWKDDHQTNGSRAILSMHSAEAGMEAVHQLRV